VERKAAMGTQNSVWKGDMKSDLRCLERKNIRWERKSEECTLENSKNLRCLGKENGLRNAKAVDGK
jgi:hypothetical protein